MINDGIFSEKGPLPRSTESNTSKSDQERVAEARVVWLFRRQAQPGHPLMDALLEYRGVRRHEHAE